MLYNKNEATVQSYEIKLDIRGKKERERERERERKKEREREREREMWFGI